MEKHKKEIKDEVTVISKIFLFARINFDHCKYLYVPDTQDEKEYISVDEHLQEIRYSLWRMTVIEMAKLFSDNKNTHVFNLFKLLEKLKPDGHYRAIKFPTDVLEEWDDILNSEKVTIDNIKLLRDKMYAHTDPAEITEDLILFDQVETLLLLVEKIIKKICITILGYEMSLTVPYRAPFDILEVLAEHHKKSYEALINFGK